MVRRRLSQIELTGGREVARRASAWAIAVLAALAALGYVLPAHRLAYQDHFHSNAADGGPLPLAVLLVVAVVAAALRRRRFGTGVITAVITMGGAVVALLPVFLAHFLSRVERAAGEDLFYTSLLGLFCVGTIIGIAEPILYIVERRRLERAERPAPLPVARVRA